ncbi:putative RNA-directed DNA polymerase [Helianthus annuus]|uniref:Putative ribonuclease H-like domain, GAG-pre-integrase domain, Gag-polypeptide of LTR copia-type n=1 Tax=Helianthus annuus TaxID=4232 RepID=A0A251TE04_HELAN|nr:putative RNA-directed DNA polymerase [Helianthus annuus]KAJ0519052.1 putative RNA-directed DNA polymerase [Helianthus annuus]
MPDSDGNNISLQIANLLKEGLNQTNTSTKHSVSDSLRINIQLNSQNFGLWSHMIRAAIGGKSKNLLYHLDSKPPESTDARYDSWEQDDLIVFSWLIQNIEPAIASNLTEFPTSKTLWEALQTTYSSGKDKLQIFDLHVKANSLKQKEVPVEDLWINLQGIWGEIDRREPNPMTCTTDINTYNRLRSEQKLFQFLNALDHRFDTVKREILRGEPLPTAEPAYATIRKETTHQIILGAGTSETQIHGIASGLATTNLQQTDGLGLISKGNCRSEKTTGNKNDPKAKLKCDHCGKPRHTKDQCFHLVGYPDWWEIGPKRNNKDEGKRDTSTTGQGSNAGGREGFGGVVSGDNKENTSDGHGSQKNPLSHEDDKDRNIGTGEIRTGRIIGRGTERQGLYYVDEVSHDGVAMLALGSVDREVWLWHRGLGHPSDGYLRLLFPNFFPLHQTLNCETCILAKSHRQSFKPNNTRVKMSFSLTHSDVWGPAKIRGGQNIRYYVTFIDDCTRMTWTYFLKTKSEVVDQFTIFHTMAETQLKTQIQTLRSDNGGEFVNDRMRSFCNSKGIIHQTTCAHTPEQNGVAERKNCILLEVTRALLIESNIPTSFWPKALATATYLLNRLPTKALNLKTPIDTLAALTNTDPPLTLEPRIFGSTVFVHIPKHKRSKLGPCAEKCVFHGYGHNQKGYRCYNPLRRHMHTTIHCKFLESSLFYESQLHGHGETRSTNDTLSWLEWPTPTPAPTTPTPMTYDCDTPATTSSPSQSEEIHYEEIHIASQSEEIHANNSALSNNHSKTTLTTQQENSDIIEGEPPNLSHPNRWRNHRGMALSETDCPEVSTTTIYNIQLNDTSHTVSRINK